MSRDNNYIPEDFRKPKHEKHDVGALSWAEMQLLLGSLEWHRSEYQYDSDTGEFQYIPYPPPLPAQPVDAKAEARRRSKADVASKRKAMFKKRRP